MIQNSRTTDEKRGSLKVSWKAAASGVGVTPKIAGQSMTSKSSGVTRAASCCVVNGGSLSISA